MVFTNLQSNEKDAFFNLLDEYFTSRPEIFASKGPSASSGAAASDAVAGVTRTLANNPETAAKLFSAGMRNMAPRSNNANANSSGSGVGESEISSIAGRVAAFSGRNNNAAPPVADKPSSSVANLKSIRKFGSDVDTSSAKNLFGSLRNSTANKSATPPPPVIPSAFTPKQNNFAPPPTRRMPSAESSPDMSSPPPPPPAPAPPPVSRYQQQQQQEEEQEEEQGEWAEALYDYDSQEPGDLNIKEGERILITDRTSDDWWTGEVNGKKGLFPASYVNLL